MAQTYQKLDGSPDGCYAAAGIPNTALTYTAGTAPNLLASVTVNFGTHRDGSGTERAGFIRITCSTGGPTTNFVYTTSGDSQHPSKYEIDTTADCAAAGGSPAGGGAGESGEETGWILVGLLIGFSCVYVGGFYVYNWKVKGAEPSERMPHKDFWMSLPDLVKVRCHHV